MGPMGERGLAAAFSSTSIIAAKKAIVKEFEEHMSMGELKAKRGGMYARNDGGYKLICCTYCSDFRTAAALASLSPDSENTMEHGLCARDGKIYGPVSGGSLSCCLSTFVCI